MSLKDKVIIITGASDGIGKAISTLFYELGAKLVLVDNPQPKLDLDNSVSMVYDPLKMSEHQEIIEKTKQEFGKIDGLVTCQKACIQKKIVKTTLEMWKYQIDYNFKSLFFLTQAVVKEMIKQGTGGTILNMISMAALSGTDNIAAYSASEAAILNLTSTLSIELQGDNIRVNAITAPYIDYPATRAGDIYLGKSPEKIKKIAYTLSPMMDLVGADKIAKIASFLMSDDSEVINGQTINIIDDDLTQIRNIITKKKIKG
ncbi:MAG: SDR family NAD(P)-dependent oxidoreductase [Candidatus Helarchaeota archaeon]